MQAMAAVKFGFPVLTSSGRLTCFGIAQVQVESTDEISDYFIRIITVTLTPHVAKAVLAGAGFDQALAAAEEELRGKDFGDDARFRSISEITVGDAFQRKPPAVPPIGASVMASWQGQRYPATVLEVSGDQVRVDWDGNESWAWLHVRDISPRT